MFKFNPYDYKGVLKRNEFIYVKDAVCDSVLLELKQFLEQIKSDNPPDDFSYLPKRNYLKNLMDVYSILTESKNLTISRNHIMYYRKGMTSIPHKDRKSLQYACAIGISSTPESRLLLWPEASTDENEGNSYYEYAKVNGGQSFIDEIVSKSKPVELYTGPGDVVFFPGSRMFHGRKSPIDSSVYYIDVNTYGLNDRESSRQERIQK